MEERKTITLVLTLENNLKKLQVFLKRYAKNCRQSYLRLLSI